MKTSRFIGMSGVLLCIASFSASAGEILGPFRGSLPAGQRRLNRVVPFHNLETTALPMPAEPRKKRRREPESSVSGQPPATGPAGTNYVQDASTISGSTDVPPMILADFPAIPRTQSFPPDPVIAAGPHHVVAAVNREIRFFTKDGALLEVVNAAAWFDPVVPGCLPFDPRVQYDHYAGRFVMLWHHYTRQPDASFYLVSVSDSDDPTGGWVSWALPGDVNGSTPSGTWADNGCLGFDSSALYVVSNQYTFGGMEPTDVRIRILPKQNLYSPPPGGQITWTDFVLGGAFCVRPAVVHGPSSAYYLLEVPNPLPYSTSVVLYRIDNPTTNPKLTISMVPVNEYFRAPGAVAHGCDTPIDTRRSYLHSEIQQVGDYIHAVHSVANPVSFSNSALRYLRINAASGTTTEDITFGAPGYWYFYPAVAVDQDENAMITFSRSSTTEYAGCYATWRYAGDGPSLRPSTALQTGWATYALLDGNGGLRWGDYSGAALDPVDRHSFWLMGEYAEGLNVWGTWARCTRVVPFAGPRLITDHNTLNFGFVDPEGAPARKWLVIRNGGSSPLTISGIATSSPLFTTVGLPPLPVVLDTYDSLSVGLAFSPPDTGSVGEVLTVTSNDATEPRATIRLQGSGIRPRGAVPGAIYALEVGRTGTVLHLVNPNGGVESSLPLSDPAVYALGVSVDDQQIYGVAGHNHGGRIARIDGASGQQYPADVLGLHGITAFSAANADTFYCGTDTGSVYRYVPSTSTMTLVAKRHGIGFSGLVNSGPERLWATAGVPPANDTVYSIDLRTAVVVPVGRTGSYVRTNSLCRGPDGGILALVDYALLRIDTLTGAGTFQAFIALEGVRSIAAGRLVTGVDPSGVSQSPLRFALEQNYPNPFNPTTLIRYELPRASDVRLSVYDMLGREVALLVDEKKGPGRYSVEFHAPAFASGVYFCRLTAGTFTQTRKMLVVR